MDNNRKEQALSEGTWVEAKHGDIKEGDVVRVTFREGPKTTITEGKVTKVLTREWNGQNVWSVENYENFYPNEFEPDDDGEFSTLERFIPPFNWPTKLGAVVSGKDDGKLVHAVLVREGNQSVWWTAELGISTVYDLSYWTELTVVSEGVTVEA